MSEILSSYALTTEEEVRALLGSTTSDDGDLIKKAINAASVAAETYCDRQLGSRSHTEYFDGGGTFLVLPHIPVTAISSIKMDSQSPRNWTTPEDTVSVANDILPGYTDSGIIRIYNNYGFFTEGQATVQVVWTGGYTKAAVPADLKFAVAKLAVLIVEHTRGHSHHLTSRSVAGGGSFSVDGVQYQHGIPPDVGAILDRYRRYQIRVI